MALTPRYPSCAVGVAAAAAVREKPNLTPSPLTLVRNSLTAAKVPHTGAMHSAHARVKGLVPEWRP